MSDERLREAERRWRETGAVEDEARYLLERSSQSVKRNHEGLVFASLNDPGLVHRKERPT